MLYLLDKKIVQELEIIKQKLLDSNYWTKNLSGACNVSSILVKALLDKNNIESVLINNHKHAFCILPINNSNYVLDLTASQISAKKFPNTFVFKKLEDVVEIAQTTVKGKLFFNTKAYKKNFFVSGSLAEVLKVNEDFENDHLSLYRILQRVCIISNITIKDIKQDELTATYVNELATQVINKLTA